MFTGGDGGDPALNVCVCGTDSTSQSQTAPSEMEGLAAAVPIIRADAGDCSCYYYTVLRMLQLPLLRLIIRFLGQRFSVGIACPLYELQY